MEFNSQICTTKEQSERLFALGLKRETADCQYAALVVDWKGNPISSPKWRFYDHNKDFIVQNFERMESIPTWSLNRLIEMMPSFIDIEEHNYMFSIIQGKLFSYGSDIVGYTFLFGKGSVYDSAIYTIEWLIKEGFFNKKYLEE